MGGRLENGRRRPAPRKASLYASTATAGGLVLSMDRAGCDGRGCLDVDLLLRLPSSALIFFKNS